MEQLVNKNYIVMSILLRTLEIKNFIKQTYIQFTYDFLLNKQLILKVIILE